MEYEIKRMKENRIGLRNQEKQDADRLGQLIDFYASNQDRFLKNQIEVDKIKRSLNEAEKTGNFDLKKDCEQFLKEIQNLDRKEQILVQ